MHEGNKKILFKKRKINLFITLAVFVMVLIMGINFAYAYYYNFLDKNMISSRVGDFDVGNDDINMIIYKKNEDGKFVKTDIIPQNFYNFNDDLTKCTKPVAGGARETIQCNDGTGNCTYAYNSDTHQISLTSNQKITCKFYFEKIGSSDIDIKVYMEDTNGKESHTINNVTKKYTLKKYAPAYGYEYVDATCDPVLATDEAIEYDSNTKKIKITAKNKHKCKVYFNAVANSDVSTNIFVQTESGSDVYNEVTSVPSDKTYILNTSKSGCTPPGSATISYVDNKIHIEATQKAECNVYLDISAN